MAPSTDRKLFAAAIVFATLVSPFVGGMRGIFTTAGWLLIPLIWILRGGQWRDVGLGRGRTAKTIAGGVAIGALTAGALLAVNQRMPACLAFVFTLPDLHRDMVLGSVPFFIAMIPVAHFIHELFYRGFVQSQLTKRLGSPLVAITLGALLYAWTHVFLFASPEFQALLARTAGPSAVAIAPHAALVAVVLFSFVESMAGGTLFHYTGSLWAPIALRATNLTVIVLALYPRVGML